MLDADPEWLSHSTSAPLDLDLGALTELTRLDLLRYSHRGHRLTGRGHDTPGAPPMVFSFSTVRQVFEGKMMWLDNRVPTSKSHV